MSNNKKTPFEVWWEAESKRPPYTPIAIAKVAYNEGFTVAINQAVELCKSVGITGPLDQESTCRILGGKIKQLNSH